jgi:NAD(P)-dependent dehydrogenase (short-subunit alcohol dehydrogenase family)
MPNPSLKRNANGNADLAPQPLHDYPTDNWNAVIAVNLQGVFYTDHEALKIMWASAAAN